MGLINPFPQFVIPPEYPPLPRGGSRVLFNSPPIFAPAFVGKAESIGNNASAVLMQLEKQANGGTCRIILQFNGGGEFVNLDQDWYDAEDTSSPPAFSIRVINVSFPVSIDTPTFTGPLDDIGTYFRLDDSGTFRQIGVSCSNLGECRATGIYEILNRTTGVLAARGSFDLHAVGGNV